MKTVFMDAMNCSIPSKSIPIKSATPWINRDIRTDIAKRECMFRKAKCSNSQDHLSRYRSLRNSIVSKICEAKKSSSRNSLNPWLRIERSGPSSDPWTHTSLSLQVLFPMAQFQLLESSTKLIFSTSSSLLPCAIYSFSYTRLKWGFSWRCSQQIWLYWSRGWGSLEKHQASLRYWPWWSHFLDAL